MRYLQFSLLLTLLLLPTASIASSGDRAPEFNNCVEQCEQQICRSSSSGPVTLPLALRLTRWTCTDDCKYTCMHNITDKAIEVHDNVYQYYGKWPFWRFAGMQEPASVLFSLLNLWGHVKGLRAANGLIPETHPMRRYYLGWGLVNVNAWIWSAVFHIRDTPRTEKLDYFSAGLAILYSLYYTVLRLFHLYPSSRQRLITSQPQHPRSRLLTLWTGLCIILYLIHVSYLTLTSRFDYTYNVIANLILGILHNLLWVYYSFPSKFINPFPLRPLGYSPPHSYKAAFVAVLTTAATALELFDFPPWGRIIDAHALWHLATAPIVVLWWSFLIQDALDDGWRPGRV